MLGYAVLLHFVGDYLIQTNWMANKKVEKWFPAFAHGVTYTLPFLLLTRSIPALLVICLTHVVIDHYRLAKHFIWAKNALFDPRPITHVTGDGRNVRAPRTSWAEAKENGGFAKSTPVWMATWLLIITDNVIHILINAAALHWL